MKYLIDLLVAYGICANKKQATQYLKSRTTEEINNLQKQFKQKAQYSLLND